jgi:hypothetical protein
MSLKNMDSRFHGNDILELIQCFPKCRTTHIEVRRRANVQTVAMLTVPAIFGDYAQGRKNRLFLFVLCALKGCSAELRTSGICGKKPSWNKSAATPGDGEQRDHARGQHANRGRQRDWLGRIPSMPIPVVAMEFPQTGFTVTMGIDEMTCQRVDVGCPESWAAPGRGPVRCFDCLYVCAHRIVEIPIVSDREMGVFARCHVL